MIVPFERLGELLEIYETEFNRRALDVAIWGHISDGNLHPNVCRGRLPTSRPVGWRFSISSGSDSPGRVATGGTRRRSQRVKQQLLAELYGQTGIDAMRAVKRAWIRSGSSLQSLFPRE